MSKHTPGPWAVEGEDCQAIVLSPSGWIIAQTDHIHSKDPSQWEDIHMANMRLIAAAPDLLESLEDLLSNLDEMGLATMPGDTFENMRETVDRARAAIAKAEGTP